MPELLIDQSRKSVYLQGQEILLSPQEYRVLHCLGRQVGQVVSKRELLAAMWGVDGDEEEDLDYTPAAVDLVIFRLRKKLHDHSANPTFLETRRGFGYLLRQALVSQRAAHTLGPDCPDLEQPGQTAGAVTPELPALAEPWATLTRREWEIFWQLADEQTIKLTNHALAQQLQMAESTLKKHLQHLYRKLGVESRASAALLAMRARIYLRKETNS